MEQKLSIAATVFNDKFNSIASDIYKRIEFKEEFKNGTGYLDPVVRLVVLEQGEEKFMIDNFGRRCILIGTLFGTVVLFERYTDSHNHWGCNYPQKLRTFGLYLGSSGITQEEPMYQMLGEYHRENIGKRLKDLLEYANGLQQTVSQ